jgi:hypothetical protein
VLNRPVVVVREAVGHDRREHDERE